MIKWEDADGYGYWSAGLADKNEANVHEGPFGQKKAKILMVHTYV